MEEAKAIDAYEDELYGEDNRGDELPENLGRRGDRLAAIAAAKKRLEQRQKEEDKKKGRKARDGKKSAKGGRNYEHTFGVPDDKAQKNFTDPDSRIMKSSEGYVQACNGSIAVDEGFQLIVATGLNQQAGDNGQLIPILEEAEKITGQAPDQVLADAGYRGEENFKRLKCKQIDGYVSLGREGKKAQATPTSRMAFYERVHILPWLYSD